MQNNHMVQLTPNNLLNNCKRLLGISTFKLPITDDELLDILYQDTLPTFSRYFPRYIKLKMNLRDCEKADNVVNSQRNNNIISSGTTTGSAAYHLDISMYGQDLVILDIEDIKNIDARLNGYGNPYFYTDNAYDLLLNSFAQANLEAMVCVPPIYFYQEPNILVIEEFGSLTEDMVSITFLLMHAYDLSTIKMTYKDKLKKLFLLDLKINLYEILKHSDNIDTPFGQINLKIDDWANAQDKREELENEWEQHFLSHRRKTVFRV